MWVDVENTAANSKYVFIIIVLEFILIRFFKSLFRAQY